MADLIQVLAPPAMVNVRGNADDPAFAAAIGMPLPGRPNSYVQAGAREAWWLGPDEWLMVEPDGDGAAIESELAAKLAGQVVSVCDVSGNRTLIRLEGSEAAALLTRGCALDLHGLPEDGCVGTIVARAQVILVRRGPQCFDLLPRRSFTGYLADWLATAATGLMEAAE